MSDQITNAPANEPHGSEQEQTAEPTIEDLQKALEEAKGHSRKWEERAKANKEAADKVAELERAKMTDEERRQADSQAVEQRVADAERERDEARAELARYRVATDFGLSSEDAEALASITDEATLRSLAERLSGRSSGPRPNPAQGNRRKGDGPMTPADAFAEALGELF